ncbi:MAG: hypothetical protein V1904_07605 [Bacteroidota bacterium]
MKKNKTNTEVAKKRVFAPELDGCFEACHSHAMLSDKEMITILSKIFDVMKQIREQGDDEYRSIWMTEERGGIRSFGSYKEYLEAGEVDNREDFKQLWLSYYPNKVKWYKFAVATYENIGYYYINSDLVFQFPFQPVENQPAFPQQKKLIMWLSEKVTDTVNRIKKDPASYNQDLSMNLPHQKRVGRILRSDLWKIFPEEKQHFKKGISQEMVEIINKVRVVPQDGPTKIMSSMTAGDFFRYCEMGYDANNYFKKATKPYTAKEKYGAMADGRDCGLKQVTENSARAFSHWYSKKSNCGGHPWEVCRGGNSTHISLYIHKNEKGWYLRLAGSSCIRVVETVRFAAALFKNNVPFILSDAEEIYRMIRGVDYIGIVPENVTPRYCHSFFPKEDKIIDFMNLGFEKENEIIKKAFWYPLSEIIPVK